MITAKKITKQDIETIFSMMVDFYAIDNYPIDKNESIKLFQTFIDNNDLGQAYLFYKDQRLIGYAILAFIFSFEMKGKIAFLDELFVLESERGKGFGKDILHFMITQSKQLGLKLIYLEVEKHNHNARDMYLKAGFENHNRDLMKITLPL
ncbi:MAG: GNAT family N-acetyltransferase [Sphingobacteriaceae bacterium]|nr:GNAT family N-acetyltransferase [Sphingobacteriaceae bacterium]